MAWNLGLGGSVRWWSRWASRERQGSSRCGTEMSRSSHRSLRMARCWRREFRRDRPQPDLEPGGPSMWCIYLDDFSDIVFAAWGVALALSGQTSESQEKLRRLYAFHGLPTNSGKALQSAISAERLGYSLDGFSGRFGILNVRAAKNPHLGFGGAANDPRPGPCPAGAPRADRACLANTPCPLELLPPRVSTRR